MELGIMLAGGGGLSVPDLVDLARRGEASGVDAVYVPESWRSGFVPVAAIAAATERVRVGAYVLNAHARTPLAAGMSAIDLDQQSGGRFVLAVGSGNHVMNEDGHGVTVHRPLAKMRDYVEVLRRVTSTRVGSPVTYEGPRHSIRGWRPQAEPVRDSMPVLLAATAPRMMDLAAEVADGIALGSLQSVDFLADVRDRARKASPRGEAFTVHCAAFVAADPDSDVARQRARRAFVDLFAVKPHPHYERLLREQGYGEFVDALLARIRDRGADGAEAEVPDDVVDRLTISGTPAECAEQIDRYRGVVDALILVNVDGMQQVPLGGRVDPVERNALRASYDVLFELAERSQSEPREEAQHG
jgi:alkanesulfonate monooxygenase SsuD/methylene tetrahydromethanopterin reductase-like flavin-dependent oxidoreductase (luciferase family)